MQRGKTCVSIEKSPVCFQLSLERLQNMSRLIKYQTASDNRWNLMNMVCGKQVSECETEIDEADEHFVSMFASRTDTGDSRWAGLVKYC